MGIENTSKKSDIVVFLDDDVTLKSDFLDKIILFFKNHPKAK
jgi:cellulose synthase/poly-beta-1,6-N-acetylglucosamine synthase-like glycosyltransferase